MALGGLGCRVVVNYHSRRDAAEAVVERVRAAGGDAVAVAGDVREPEPAERVVTAAVTEFGRLDALVCNAATLVTCAPFAEMSFVDLAGKVTDELAAAYHPVRCAIPHLTASGAGRLVFVSSDLSRRSRVPAAIAWLASGLAGYLTGVEVPVTGGLDIT